MSDIKGYTEKIQSWLRRFKPIAKRWCIAFARQLPLPMLFGLLLITTATTSAGYEMIYPSQLFAVIMFYVGTAVLVSLIYSVFLKDHTARLLASVLAIYVLLIDFDQRLQFALRPLKIIFPFTSRSDGFQAFTFLVIVLVAIGFLARFIVRIATKKVAPATQYQALTVVVVAMSLVALVQFIPVFSSWRQAAGINLHTQLPVVTKDTNDTSKPDVYYLVFDRYASDQSLKDNFGFDNSEMSNFLREQGFVVKENAFSNYHTTAPSVSSTLRMDYHADLSDKYSDFDTATSLPYRRIFEDSPVSQFLRSQGYETMRLGSWWGISRKENSSTNINPHYQMELLGRSGIIDEFHGLVLSRSYLGNLLEHGIGVGSLNLAEIPTADYRDIFHDQIKTLEGLAQHKQKTPRFIFAHMLIPHPPYVFDKDGSRVLQYETGDNNNDVARSLKYANQLTYVNEQIKDLVATIQTNNRDAVIIVQADEGPHPVTADVVGWEAPYPWEDAPTEALKLKLGVQAAYYLPGDNQAEEHAKQHSSVNIFRTIFNTYLGTEMPYLPDCSFVYNPNQPFRFIDVTAKLYGSEAPACANIHSTDSN